MSRNKSHLKKLNVINKHRLVGINTPHVNVIDGGDMKWIELAKFSGTCNFSIK